MNGTVLGTIFLSAALVSVQPLVSEDVLEPSIQNEVDHAVSMAPQDAWVTATNAAPILVTVDASQVDLFGTNGLSSTEIALKLITTQGADGRWCKGTNDVTAVALRILGSL